MKMGREKWGDGETKEFWSAECGIRRKYAHISG